MQALECDQRLEFSRKRQRKEDGFSKERIPPCGMYQLILMVPLIVMKAIDSRM